MPSNINRTGLLILFTGLILGISPVTVFAHNPLSAKYRFEAGEPSSLLTIQLSQRGVDHALIKKYSQEYLDSLNPQAFEELIVKYVKTNFYLAIDGKRLELGAGGIRYGSHQTDLKFVMPAVSGNARKLKIGISAFAENGHHQSIFSYDYYGKEGYLILSQQNGFAESLDLVPEKPVEPAPPTTSRGYVFAGLALLGAGILVLLFRRGRKMHT